MTKFTTIVAAAGLALIASTPAFANKAGGPDTLNPVVKEGTPVSSNAGVQVWTGRSMETEPVVLAETVTGTVSDPSDTYQVGRLTYHVIKAPSGGGETELASGPGDRVVIS